MEKNGYGRSGPVYKGSLEELSTVLSGNRQFSSQEEAVAARIHQQCGLEVGRQTQINRGYHYLAETVRPQPPHKSAGGTRRKPGEFLSCASLSEAKISKDERPTKHCTASNASSLSLSVGSYLHSLQISRLLMDSKTSHKSASAKHGMSLHHMMQPEISTSPSIFL